MILRIRCACHAQHGTDIVGDKVCALCGHKRHVNVSMSSILAMPGEITHWVLFNVTLYVMLALNKIKHKPVHIKMFMHSTLLSPFVLLTIYCGYMIETLPYGDNTKVLAFIGLIISIVPDALFLIALVIAFLETIEYYTKLVKQSNLLE